MDKKTLTKKLPKDIARSPLTENDLKEIASNDIVFQAVAWYGSDFENTESDSGDSYQIYICGLSKLQDRTISVTLRIPDFTPYFYVELPNNFKDIQVCKLYDYLKKRLKGSWDPDSKDYPNDISYGLLDKQFIKKKKLFPFTNGAEFKFMKLAFSNMKAFRYTKAILDKDLEIKELDPTKKLKFNLYETNVDPINRFCHVRDIATTGHIRVPKGQYYFETAPSFGNEESSDPYEHVPEIHTRTQLAINCSYKIPEPYICDDILDLRILSYDIETQEPNSDRETKFPDANFKECYIGQIGITLWSYVTGSKTKIILTNKKCADMNDVIVLSNDNERDMLMTFANLIEVLDPDFITGYNIWRFDDKYISIRMKILSLENDLNKFSRLTKVKSSLKLRKMSSSARGDNTFEVIEVHGRQTFDLYVAIKNEHKLASYKLDIVGQEFTGQRKDDLPYKEIFRLMKSDDPNDIATVAKYCIQDTNLVVEILSVLSIIPNYIEMAKATFVPLDYLLFRGQQCKAFSLIAKEARSRGIVIPSKMPYDAGTFPGASVRTPQRGAYYKPVAGLDFASLYPSIMIAYNLCYSTLVIDEKYKNMPGIVYEVFKWTVDGKTYENTFVQAETKVINHANDNEGSNAYTGILPTILSKLMLGRKETKKRMKTVKEGSMLYKILDGKQLAQKITMNSIYGFTGTGEKGMLPCKAIASSVTCRGREMIEKTSNLAQELYPCSTLYGDSIPGYEQVYLNDIKYKASELESVVKNVEWTDYRTFKSCDKDYRFAKEQLYLNDLNYTTMTSDGPTKLKRIIRHKVPGKKLYKITVKDSDGLLRTVTVTEGHSLVDSDEKYVSAETLKVGMKLLEVKDI
jgi:DNA polymerase delta subunit 1